ncbi:MAG: 4-aminobutyrate aminotransferase/(S)-3-amino-2-methylpropionate transaminase [Glaciecola sp.]|jgi:hypothetical protein
MVNPYEVAVELSEKLTAIAPGNSQKKAILFQLVLKLWKTALKLPEHIQAAAGLLRSMAVSMVVQI